MASESLNVLGRMTSGQPDRIRTPRIERLEPRHAHPIILMTGGSGTPTLNRFTDIRHLALALQEDGYSVFMPNVAASGGAGFGNNTALARVEDAVAYLQTRGYTSPPIIIGQSNGSSAGQRYAQEHPVAGFIAVLPPLAMEYLYDNNVLGLTATLNAAFGISEAPLPDYGSWLVTAANGGFDGVPMQIYYSTNDDLTLGTGDALNDFLADVPSATAISVGALGHTSTACNAVNTLSVMGFVQEHTS